MHNAQTLEAEDGLESLLPYCTPAQERTIRAIIEAGSVRKGAKVLGVNPRNVFAMLARIRKHATRRGHAPEYDLTHPAPPGYAVKGTSTLYDGDGNLRAQWIKTREDQDAIQAAFDAAAEAMSGILPREAPRPLPARTIADLCNCYVITDYHLGMLAWHEETGADWDIGIAEDLLVNWFSAAIAQAPAADTAIFAQLGDFLHRDGMDAVTPTSGHQLDADTRFQKLVRVAIRAIRRVIGMLLEKHRHVHVLMCEGNHDLASAVWLREWLSAVYEAEPRITVDRSPDPYYCFEWGKTALFFHHGHKRKPVSVDAVFAAKFREVFGRTKHAYAHLGHLHHVHALETPLMIVEQHRTLAAPDAYASRGGWISGRDAAVITYHKRHGEVGRCRISPQMAESSLPPIDGRPIEASAAGPA